MLIKKTAFPLKVKLIFVKEFEEGQAYKTYIDKGFSGKDTNRPAFENMMNDIRAGQIKK